MLARNRPHEISMCLDLTLENVVTVTDVIGYEYAHQPRSSCCWSPALSGWRERHRYEVIVPGFHIGMGQDLSANKKIITLMKALMTFLHLLQSMNAWINGCSDELFKSK